MTTDWHKACRDAADACRGGIAWVNEPQNGTALGLEQKAVDRRLRRLTTELSRLDRSVDRPMGVSVFGPSQAGKSYLSSILAGGTGGRSLMARFAGEPEDFDFLAKVNPLGGEESTGVVTRFSLRLPPSPDGFPVCLRLLSEIELIKILGNSYFLDCDPKHHLPLTAEMLAAALAGARGRASDLPSSDNRLRTEDVWDLQDYFERTFEGSRHIEVLRTFWDEASLLAPKLPIAERAELFSLIWGKLPEFTGIFVELTRALAQLGFAEQAFCPIAALVPRTESIIDVRTLKDGIGQPDQPMLQIRALNGPVVLLPRPMITALIAELHITIAEKPWPFFEHTDLLDFPGARSRTPEDLPAKLKDPANKQLGESILRGKVAYLFERYVSEQELTSMLLCVKPSAQEVATLPAMINDWIAVSHGATPAARVGKTVVLFFVLTWFDTHFNETAGDEEASLGERFATRLRASLTGYVGRPGWAENWTPDQPFNNCFWLRNPSYKAEFLIRYDGKVEQEILPQKEAFVAKLRAGYLAVPAVSRFFRDPARAFDEGLKLNDGGVSYLAEQLTPICRPQLKDEQIRGRLSALREEMVAALAPFYIDSDVDKRLAERRAVSYRILQHVQHLAAQRRFADLVAALQISEEALARFVYDAYSRRSTVLANGSDTASGPEPKAANGLGRAGAPPLPGIPPLPGMPPLPGIPPLPGMAAPSAPAATPVRRDTIETYLARAVLQHWIGVLYSDAGTEHLGRFFTGEPKLAMELVNEIANAVRRLRLDEQLGSAISKLAGGLNEEIDTFLEKVSFASSALLNRFVNEFGYDRVPVRERPSAPGSDSVVRPVFAPRIGANSAADFDSPVPNHQYDQLVDWMYALHDLIECNAKSVDGQSFNIEQNARLGAILNSCRQPLAGAGARAG